MVRKKKGKREKKTNSILKQADAENPWRQKGKERILNEMLLRKVRIRKSRPNCIHL